VTTPPQANVFLSKVSLLSKRECALLAAAFKQESLAVAKPAVEFCMQATFFGGFS